MPQLPSRKKEGHYRSSLKFSAPLSWPPVVKVFADNENTQGFAVTGVPAAPGGAAHAPERGAGAVPWLRSGGCARA